LRFHHLCNNRVISCRRGIARIELFTRERGRERERDERAEKERKRQGEKKRNKQLGMIAPTKSHGDITL